MVSVVDEAVISESRDIGSVSVFSPIVGKKTLEFEPYINGTFKDTETGSVWDNLGKCIEGKYKGKELQNLGDGFMLSFRSASAAIKCACEIQREIVKNLPKIKIRIGINTGEIVHREGKHPFGQAVVIASRIVSKAKGDEIIVSDVVKQLTAGSKFNFLDKGWFKLKGISDNIRLHEMSWKE